MGRLSQHSRPGVSMFIFMVIEPGEEGKSQFDGEPGGWSKLMTLAQIHWLYTVDDGEI